MSKKKLLSEAQVKRFMGLAGLSPLNEMYHEKEEGMREEEELDEMRGEMKKDDEMREEMEDETPEAEMPPMADEEPAEMEPEEEPEMEGGAADVEMDEQDLADVADALSVLQDKLAPLLDQANLVKKKQIWIWTLKKSQKWMMNLRMLMLNLLRKKKNKCKNELLTKLLVVSLRESLRLNALIKK